TWPAMLLAAGLDVPKQVFGHGFVYIKNEETGAAEKISKSLGNVVEPMDIITKFSAEAFRYYFMRECPFPGDGEFSWSRFADVYNSELANNLGNLYSRAVTLVTKNFGGVLSKERKASVAVATWESEAAWIDRETLGRIVPEIQAHIEACQYNVALQKIWQQILTPANQYAERAAPWKMVKTNLGEA